MVKKIEDMFIRFDIIHELERQTDRQTDGHTDGHCTTVLPRLHSMCGKKEGRNVRGYNMFEVMCLGSRCGDATSHSTTPVILAVS